MNPGFGQDITRLKVLWCCNYILVEIISRKLGTIFIHKRFLENYPQLYASIITAKNRAKCRLRFFKSRLGKLTRLVSHLTPIIVLCRRLFSQHLMFNFSTLGLKNICNCIRNGLKEYSLETIIISI